MCLLSHTQVPDEAESRDGDDRVEERSSGDRNDHRSGRGHEYAPQVSKDDPTERREPDPDGLPLHPG